MAENKREQEKAELHKALWKAATDLVHGGGVSVTSFMGYIFGAMFYRYISENLANYINEGEREAGESKEMVRRGVKGNEY